MEEAFRNGWLWSQTQLAAHRSEGRSPWPPPGPRPSRCKPSADGNSPPCPPTMSGASSRPAAAHSRQAPLRSVEAPVGIREPMLPAPSILRLEKCLSERASRHGLMDRTTGVGSGRPTRVASGDALPASGDAGDGNR